MGRQCNSARKNCCRIQGLIKDEPAYLADLEKGFSRGKVPVNFTDWPGDEIYAHKYAAEAVMHQNYYNKNLKRKTRLFFMKVQKKLS